MTEPTPLTLYAGREYLVQVLPSAIDNRDVAGILPTAWSQNDPLWRDSEYAPGYTFRAAGCLVCCVAMLASIAYPSAPTPVEVAARLREVGCFAGGLLTYPSRIAAAYDRLTWGGYLHWRDVAARLDVLHEEIAQYGATIIELAWNPLGASVPQQSNQHFAVATGVVSTVTPPDVRIIDPWDGQQKWVSQSPYAKPANWAAPRAIHGVRLLRIV